MIGIVIMINANNSEDGDGVFVALDVLDNADGDNDDDNNNDSNTKM